MTKLTKAINNPAYALQYMKNKIFSNSKLNKIEKKYKEKNSQECMKELSNLINSFDVNTLKVNSEYVWPYLRNRLWIQLYGIGNGNENRRNLSIDFVQKGSDKNLPFKSRKNLKKEYKALELDDLEKRNRQVDFLFFTIINAAEQVVLDNGKIYHRITDPFYEIAKKVGNAEKIEILKVKSRAIKKSKKYFHPVTHLLSPYIFRTGYIKKIRFGNLLSTIKKEVPSVEYSGETLRKAIDWEFHTRDFYIDILKIIKPKVVFFNGYHFHAPLISAADKLGIISVDIQHGIQVGWNPLYNDWKEMPKEGYQAIPEHFFVWGEKDFNSIKKVFFGEKHSPILVGSPWIERQLELTNTMEDKYIKEFKKYKVKTLLILQNQTEVPKIYKDLIKKSPKDYLWVVRHHPKGNRFNKSDFSSINQKNIFLSDYFDTITLSQLFKHINIVVSAGSTVSAEADYAGLYNFIFSKKGKDNYIDEIKNGAFFTVDNYHEFYQIVETLDMKKRESRANAYAKVDIESIFKNFLDEKKESNSE